MSFRYLSHTADLRARLDAASLPELYQSAVDLVRDVLVGDSPVLGSESRLLPATEGRDAGENLFRFIRELVYLYDTEAFLPLIVEIDDGYHLAGECFDPNRHSSERGIKALTRHGFRFAEGAGGYEAELIFDL